MKLHSKQRTMAHMRHTHSPTARLRAESAAPALRLSSEVPGLRHTLYCQLDADSSPSAVHQLYLSYAAYRRIDGDSPTHLPGDKQEQYPMMPDDKQQGKSTVFISYARLDHQHATPAEVVERLRTLVDDFRANPADPERVTILVLTGISAESKARALHKAEKALARMGCEAEQHDEAADRGCSLRPMPISITLDDALSDGANNPAEAQRAFTVAIYTKMTAYLENARLATPMSDLGRLAVEGADAPAVDTYGALLRGFSREIARQHRLLPVFLWSAVPGTETASDAERQDLRHTLWQWLTQEVVTPLTRSASALFVVAHDAIDFEWSHAALRARSETLPVAHPVSLQWEKSLRKVDKGKRQHPGVDSDTINEALAGYREIVQACARQSGIRVEEGEAILDKLAVLRGLDVFALRELMRITPASKKRTPPEPSILRHLFHQLQINRLATWDTRQRRLTFDASLRTLLLNHWLHTTGEAKHRIAEWHCKALTTWTNLLTQYPQNISRYAREVVYHLIVLRLLDVDPGDWAESLPVRPELAGDAVRKALITYISDDGDIAVLLRDRLVSDTGDKESLIAAWVDALLHRQTPEMQPEPAG